MQDYDSTFAIPQRRKGAGHFTSLIAWWPAAFLLLVFMAAPAHAQYSASLQGTVTDSTGALISGATLTLTDKETNHAALRTSSDTGNFTFNQLPPSTYMLVVYEGRIQEEGSG